MAFTPRMFGSPSRGLVRVGQSERFQQFSSFRFSPSTGKSSKSQTHFGQSLRKIGDSTDDFTPTGGLSFISPLPGVAALDKVQRLDNLRASFNKVAVGLEEVDCQEDDHTLDLPEEIKDHFKFADEKEVCVSKMKTTDHASVSNIPRRDCGRMKADNKFKRFSSIRSSLKKIKTSVNTGSNSNAVIGGEKSLQEIVSPVKTKGHESSKKLEILLSPFKKDDSDYISPLRRRDEPELKIKIVDENSDFSDIVKDATTMAGFSSSILAKYRRHRMSLLFEDRCCEHIDLGSEFITCLE